MTTRIRSAGLGSLQEGSGEGKQGQRNSQDLWIGVSRDLLITTL